MVFKLHIIVFLLTTLNSTQISANEKELTIDARHRPPEMTINNKDISGPLIEVAKAMAFKAGFYLKWRIAPFSRSIKELEKGNIDLLPRTIWTEKRAQNIKYLGPIGYQEKNIFFIVRKNLENSIVKYDDLKKYQIGVKLRAAYFKKFNEDNLIKKVPFIEDDLIAKRFKSRNLDVIAVLDVKSMEEALKKNGVSSNSYAYAKYKYLQKIPNYFGFTKNPKKNQAFNFLSKVIDNMRKSGEIKNIYQKYQLKIDKEDLKLKRRP